MVAKSNSRSRIGRLRTIVLTAFGFIAACDSGQEPVTEALQTETAYVGSAVCVDCHQQQAAEWLRSHHRQAMQRANTDTVIGDFADAEFSYNGITSRFTQRDGRFLVTTDGSSGESQEFEIAATFGIRPLQQYLIELDRGRWQALSIAWDSRTAEEGGQRWFHLYPEDDIDSDDPLHWTGVFQRWNTMCADCHSTNLQKGYDAAADTFSTTWDEIDVGCEACHGPGSLHASDTDVAPPALPASSHSWVFDSELPIASRVPAIRQQAEIEVCAQCHSLRTQLTDDYDPGDMFLDAYRPELLLDGLYHADGQVLAEVYVYGSFMQSAMASAGVTCTDCHEPHSGELRLPGNGVCAQCHRADVFDRPEHHQHAQSTAASQCVSCHMRDETFMVIDDRRDHSFRVPRPDLSASLGSPNACNDCHDDESSDWAARRVAEWFPNGRWNEPHFGQAIHAGRTLAMDGRTRLLELIADESAPAIARATALQLLPSWLADSDAALLQQGLEGDEPLVTLAAIEAAAGFAADTRVDLVQRFLTHELLAVRVAAARVLLTARDQLSARRQLDLDAAVDEFLATQTFNSDRAQGFLSRSIVAVERGQLEMAEQLLLEAIERHASDTALHVNLAELYRSQGRFVEAERVLRDALDRHPDDAALALGLGYVLVVSQRADQALPLFEQAAAAAPEQPLYTYVLAIAQNDIGDSARAEALLRETVEAFPGYTDALYALATMLRDDGRIDSAYEYAERLNTVHPGNPLALSLLLELEQQL